MGIFWLVDCGTSMKFRCAILCQLMLQSLHLYLYLNLYLIFIRIARVTFLIIIDVIITMFRLPLCLGYCQGDGYRVGFGECAGTILPSLQH